MKDLLRVSPDSGLQLKLKKKKKRKKVIGSGKNGQMLKTLQNIKLLGWILIPEEEICIVVEKRLDYL